MTWLEILLSLGLAALTAQCVLTRVSRREAIENAVREYRIALDFVAEEGASLPHEFAACFLAGNGDAIARNFRGFHAFRAERLAEMEAWEAAE